MLGCEQLKQLPARCPDPVSYPAPPRRLFVLISLQCAQILQSLAVGEQPFVTNNDSNERRERGNGMIAAPATLLL